MAHAKFKFTNSDFDTVVRLVGEKTGIVLGSGKRQMVYGRLSRRLRALGMEQFEEYLGEVSREGSGELVNFVNAMTTNLTSFFREKHHFDYLRDVAIPNVIKRNTHKKRIRIWSAGCSTGEEPYSIAMTMKDIVSKMPGWDVEIVATDIDSDVLSAAAQGVYKHERVGAMTSHILREHFLCGKGSMDGMVKLKRDVRELIRFHQLNLIESWKMDEPFDLIFCRNVLIYFDKETQRGIVSRFAESMVDGGNLFLGHSESLFKVSDRFRLIGNTIYQKD